MRPVAHPLLVRRQGLVGCARPDWQTTESGPQDDPILGTALASEARTIISFDQDLLVLGKPFGIAVLRPREFLALLRLADLMRDVPGRQKGCARRQATDPVGGWGGVSMPFCSVA